MERRVPEDVYIGDLVELYGNNGEPIGSILTGYKIENLGFKILYFGIIRIDLTDQLIEKEIKTSLF